MTSSDHLLDLIQSRPDVLELLRSSFRSVPVATNCRRRVVQMPFGLSTAVPAMGRPMKRPS